MKGNVTHLWQKKPEDNFFYILVQTEKNAKPGEALVTETTRLCLLVRQQYLFYGYCTFLFVNGSFPAWRMLLGTDTVPFSI